MKTTLSVAEARTQLARLVRGKETISLRQRDETVAFLVPRERMEALLETMEILSNPAAMRALKQVWGESTADTLSYMDVDLSTDLRAFAPTGSGTAASIAALDWERVRRAVPCPIQSGDAHRSPRACGGRTRQKLPQQNSWSWRGDGGHFTSAARQIGLLARRRHHVLPVSLGTATCGPSRTRSLQPMS